MPIYSPSRMHSSSNNRNIHPSNMQAFPSIDGVGQRRQEVEIICLDLLRRFQQACRYISTNLVSKKGIICRHLRLTIYYYFSERRIKCILFFYFSIHPRRSAHTWLSITESASSLGKIRILFVYIQHVQTTLYLLIC